jgi:RNA polymerase sigma-70 factor (ECF subfamily)
MAISDSDLIIEFNNGNTARFEELVYRYDRQVLSMALKYAKDEDDAKDIYQEVFIRVYKSLKNFQFRSEFSTWLFRITTNVCLTYKSRGSRRKFVPITEEWDEKNLHKEFIPETGYDDTSPDKILSGNELREYVDEAIDLLPPKQKICFILKHYEGYKIKEIAGMMNCKEGTIKKYLFESVQKLKTHLRTVYEF